MLLRDQSRSKEEQIEEEALRNLFLEAERVGGTDAFVKGAQLVIALEQSSTSVQKALALYRDGVADYYKDIAAHFKGSTHQLFQRK